MWIWGMMVASGLAAAASDPVRLVVAHNWDGARLAVPAATVSLVATPDHLRVEVSAPYHRDPVPPAEAGPLDGLWNHEVVELFVAGAAGEDGRVPYTELELGPHGHHLVLRLDGVRSVVEKALPLVFDAQIEAETWRGVAEVPWSYLPKGPWTGNAYAIHGTGEQRRYRAAFPVPGTAPDFHQPDRFRPLDLEKPPSIDNVR